MSGFSGGRHAISLAGSRAALKALRAIALAVMFGATAVVALAQATAPALPRLDSLNGAHVEMDDLNILLLYLIKTGKAYDPVPLVAMSASVDGDEIKQAYDRYLQSTDSGERFRYRTVLEYLVKDRAEMLNGSRPYLLRLDARLGHFDPRQNQFPLVLSLDSRQQSHDPSRQCLPPYRPLAMPVTICLVSNSLVSGDPVFTGLPVDNPQVAAQWTALQDQGRLRVYALASDAGGALTDAATGGSPGAWRQPVTLFGLILVDIGSGNILAAAQTQAVTQAMKTGNVVVQATATPGPVVPAPASPVAPAASAQARQPAAGTPPGTPAAQVAANPPPAPRQAPPPAVPPSDVPGGNPIPGGDGGILDLDRVLAQLALAVYGSHEKYLKGAWRLEDIKAKIGRIGADTGRSPSLRASEIKKLEGKQQKEENALRDLNALLALKDQVCEKYGLTRVETEKGGSEKIYFDRYHTRDGREIIAFRGTDGLTDLMTDAELVMNPDMLGSLSEKVQSGQRDNIREKVAGWMATQASNEVSTNPRAFDAANALVASMIRSGIAPAKIILTGHSLGGGLAQFAGLKNSVGTVVTFNPSPLSASLLHDLSARKRPAGQTVRHYISYVPGATPADAGTFDPVSQIGKASRTTDVLRVIGNEYVVNVCTDFDSDAFHAFENFVQEKITRMTVSTMAIGTGSVTKPAAYVGGVIGGESASTDVLSAAHTGYKDTKRTATNVMAGVNCIQHPFLCASAAAGGGLVSVTARAKAPGLWSLYTAHRMRNLNEALNGETHSDCGQVAPLAADAE